jgi:hypothetical protein
MDVVTETTSILKSLLLRSRGGPGAMHVGTLSRSLLALVSLAAACCDRRSQPSGICGTANHEGL